MTPNTRRVLLNVSTLDDRVNGRPVRVRIDPTSLYVKSSDSTILADNPELPPEVDLTGALVRPGTPPTTTAHLFTVNRCAIGPTR